MREFRDILVRKLCKRSRLELELCEKYVIFVDRETLSSIHNALIRPHFYYCSEVWDTLGMASPTDFKKVGSISDPLKHLASIMCIN